MKNIGSKITYLFPMDKEFKKLIELNFKDYLVCGFINGRAALYLSEKDMDIDVCVVLKDSIIKKRGEFRKMWRNFVIGYRDIHFKYGFKPDNAFPGDFLTISQAYDVIEGRGFVEKGGQIYVQPMGSITDESDENDYRIFRSMFIIGRIITGNKPFFNEIKILSLETLLKYFFIINKKLSIKGVVDEFLSGAEKEKYGFDNRYEPYFSRYIIPLIQKTIKRLNQCGYVKTDDRANFQCTQDLVDWGRNVLKKQWSSFHLMKFQDPFYVQEREKIFVDIKAGSHLDKLTKK